MRQEWGTCQIKTYSKPYIPGAKRHQILWAYTDFIKKSTWRRDKNIYPVLKKWLHRREGESGRHWLKVLNNLRFTNGEFVKDQQMFRNISVNAVYQDWTITI